MIVMVRYHWSLSRGFLELVPESGLGVMHWPFELAWFNSDYTMIVIAPWSLSRGFFGNASRVWVKISYRFYLQKQVFIWLNYALKFCWHRYSGLFEVISNDIILNDVIRKTLFSSFYLVIRITPFFVILFELSNNDFRYSATTLVVLEITWRHYTLQYCPWYSSLL